MFHLKVHRQGNEVLVAACDQELLGKRLKQGSINLHVKEEFYGGDLVGEGDLLENLREATIANLVGDVAVEAALKGGYVDEECVLFIDNVKHAQVVKIL
jgi:hypothetical protein